MTRRASYLTILITIWSLCVVPESRAEVELRRCSAENFPLVFLNVAVRDDTGAPVAELTTDDFECFEDGVRQTELFTAFPPGEGPGVRGADIIFLIDTSASMDEEIAQVQNNVKAFADGLAERGVTVGLGLIAFGTGAGDVRNGGALTTDTQEFKDLVDSLPSLDGNEQGFATLRNAIGSFDFLGIAQKIFILVTDEDSDGPSLDVPSTEAEKQQTIDLMLANEVRVFAFADCSVDSSTSHYCDSTSVPVATGGFQRNVTDDFEEIFDEIEPLIADTYVLRYETENLASDGNERTIECSVLRPGVEGTVECTYTPNSAPRIALTPETRRLKALALEPGEQPILGAIVTDIVDPRVESVTLFYRTSRIGGGGGGYTAIPMVKTGDEQGGDGEIFTAQVPPLVPPGLDFFIRATDGIENSAIPQPQPATEPFSISVLPNFRPQIAHNPVLFSGAGAGGVASAAATRDVQIGATVTDSTDFVQEVTLFWRNRGEVIYREIAMTGSARRGAYLATIPGPEVNELVEYYIRAVDNLGVSSTFGEAESPCPHGELCGFDFAFGRRAVRSSGAIHLQRR